MANKPATVRLDKWLWYARFFKSRTLAAKFCQGGGLRINNELCTKSHATVQAEDVLAFIKGGRERVIHILELGHRRGAAAEAQALYEDQSPEIPKKSAREADPHAHREPGQGRPTKAERRAIDKLKLGS